MRPFTLYLNTVRMMDRRIFRRLVLAGFIQNFVLSVTGMIDCAVVGRYLGTDGLSAMQLAMPVFSLLSLFSMILGTGLSVAVSREMTRGETERAAIIFDTVIETVLLISSAVTLIGIFCPSLVTVLLAGRNVDAQVFSRVTDYLKPVLSAAIPYMLYEVLGILSMLEGADRYLRYSSIVLLSVDIAGDLLAVRLNAGLSGIAAASAAAYLFSFMTVAYFFVSGRSMFHFRFIRPDFGALVQVVTAGLPMIMRILSEMIWPMAVNRLMLKYGTLDGLAALSIQDAVHYFPAALCFGLASTVLILSGIYAGEQDGEGMKQLGKQILQWSLIGGLLMAFVMGLSAGFVLQLFTRDAEILRLSTRALYYFLAGVPFLAFNLSAASFLQGIGRNRSSGAVLFVDHILAAIASAAVLAKLFGTEGIFASYFVCELITSLLLAAAAFIFFRKRSFLEISGSDAVKDEFRCSIETVEEAVNASTQLHEFCLKNEISSRKAYHISLCAEELAVNSIEHGFNDGRPHQLQMRAAITGDMLILRLRDDCRHFNLVERYRMINPDEPEKNIGLRIIFASADDVSYSSALDLNNVCVKVQTAK